MSTISSVSSVSLNVDVTAVSAPAPSPPEADGVSVSMSKRAQLMSSLDSLASSDPDKFKAVTAKIADQLHQAASGQSGRQADFLNQVADRFSAAAQSGSPADLAPPSGQVHHQARHHGHHHGHHGGGGASATTAPPAGASTVQDPGNRGGDNVGATIEGIISDALAS